MLYICISTYTHIFTHVGTYVSMYVCMYKYIRMHEYIYVCMYVCAYTHGVLRYSKDHIIVFRLFRITLVDS